MLLIGESGVGKSTWINAVANYCKFISLEEAVQAGGLFPVPCAFKLTDPETTEIHTKWCGADDTHATSQTPKFGESVTQMSGVYQFQYETIQINLIDTPGLSDTQDTSDHDRDKQRVKNILRILSTYDEIHAICIMIKASENRLTKALKYTLTELLKHLDKDACNNVIFIFTHAASTDFEPAEPKEILQKFLKDKQLPIIVDKSTVYCFENNTMGYIAQCKTITFQSKHMVARKANWEESVASTKAMQ